MKVFVTGGSGFVGSAVIPELVAAGHEVVALARSGGSAEKVKALGAKPLEGSLANLDALEKGAAQADGILHLAYIHDPREASNAAKTDRAAITAMAGAVKGTGKPFVMTSGVTGIFGKNQKGSEQETPQTNFITGTRVRAERLLLGYADKGVGAMVMRLSPFVHGEGDKAFTATYIAYAQKNGEAVYVGKGENIWPAVHRLDAAHLYLLALEKGRAGAVYHAVAEGVPAKQAAGAVSQKLGLPLRSVGMLGALRRLSTFGIVVSLNTPANSAQTRRELGWQPTRPSLLKDIAADHYYKKGGR